jgi:energy-coupling factor transport system substrate-specific component
VNRRTVYLRTLAVAVGIGVLGGLLLIPVNAYAVKVAPMIPLLYAPIVGVWLLPVVTSMLTLRRPGAGIVTALVAGFVNLPLATYGFRAFLSMVVIGVFLELAIALTLYRRWGKPVFAVALAVASILVAALTWRGLRLESAELPEQVAFVALLIAGVEGSLVLAALFARLLEETRLTRGLAPRGRPTRSSERLLLGDPARPR